MYRSTLVIILIGLVIVIWMLWLYDPLEEIRETPKNQTAESYPAHLPQNFKDAPKKLECETDRAGRVFAKFYLHRNEGWSLIILGKSGEDAYIYFKKTLEGEEGNGVAMEEWAKKDGHWINVEKLSENEKQEWIGGNMLFSAMEKFLIASCYKSKMSELLKK